MRRAVGQKGVYVVLVILRLGAHYIIYISYNKISSCERSKFIGTNNKFS